VSADVGGTVAGEKERKQRRCVSTAEFTPRVQARAAAAAGAITTRPSTPTYQQPSRRITRPAHHGRPPRPGLRRPRSSAGPRYDRLPNRHHTLARPPVPLQRRAAASAGAAARTTPSQRGSHGKTTETCRSAPCSSVAKPSVAKARPQRHRPRSPRPDGDDRATPTPRPAAPGKTSVGPRGANKTQSTIKPPRLPPPRGAVASGKAGRPASTVQRRRSRTGPDEPAADNQHAPRQGPARIRPPRKIEPKLRRGRSAPVHARRQETDSSRGQPSADAQDHHAGVKWVDLPPLNSGPRPAPTPSRPSLTSSWTTRCPRTPEIADRQAPRRHPRQRHRARNNIILRRAE